MEMQEAIKAWEELEIKDDFMFAKVMRDKKLCKKLLERLLQTKIRDIVYLEEQKPILPRDDRLEYNREGRKLQEIKRKLCDIYLYI